MPRPVSIQDEVILNAARELFLERGLDVATSEIAARAGVSQGTIFKRFRTKQALFIVKRACLLARPRAIDQVIRLIVSFRRPRKFFLAAVAG